MISNSVRTWPVLLLPTAIFICTGIEMARGEVTLDGSFGTSGELIGPHVTIPDSVGKTLESNLFHSFSDFNIGLGERATFTGPAAIQNILSRVTGGNPSEINGYLGSNIPGANLYFLNPAGVMFGPGAQLGVQGSFHVSTADYLRLSDNDNVRFNAVPSSADKLLNASPPEAFGFLSQNPESLIIQNSSLKVENGNTLSVIGGDIEVLGGSQLVAPGGNINLTSVAAKGEVVFTANSPAMDAFDRLGEVSLIQNSWIHNIGTGSGQIVIRGGKITMDNSNIIANTNGTENGGGVNIRANNLTMRDGSNILSSSDKFTTGKTGDIYIDAAKIDMNEDPSSGQHSGLFVDNIGLGKPGNIYIKTDELVLGGIASILNVGGVSSGAVGSISINSSRSVNITGPGNIIISSVALGGSLAGNISINTPYLFIQNNNDTNLSGLSTLTTGQADAGNINLDVIGKILISGNVAISADTSSENDTPNKGNAGNIIINAGELAVSDGAHISSGSLTSEGRAGDIIITANGTLKILESRVASSTQGINRGGDIHISANQVTLDGARISASTLSQGQGGNIHIIAIESVLLKGVNMLSESTEKSDIAGKSGNIFIKAGDLFRLIDESLVSVETNQSDAGNININVGRLIHLSENSAITTSAAVFNAEGTGNGGDICIGSATCGSVLSPDFIVLDKDSEIVANAKLGSGGEISIKTNYLFQSQDSLIDASAGPAGIDGRVETDAPDTNIIGSITELPAIFFDAVTFLTKPCAQRFGADFIRLTMRKYEVLPDSPYALRVPLLPSVSKPRPAHHLLSITKLSSDTTY